MSPTTVELLRDILREAEFLQTHAVQTTRDDFLANKLNKAPNLAAELREILRTAGQL